MNENKSREQGQALILIILGLVGLLGMAALAIDGGMLYSDRRFAQNSADAAALAGAGAAASKLKNASLEPTAWGYSSDDWDCSSPTVQEALDIAVDRAKAYALENGEFDLATSADFWANGNIVSTYCDPVEKRIDVRVSTAMDTRTSLVHFVYSSPTRNTVDAISSTYPRKPVGAGYSIISLTDECTGWEKGLRFTGTSNVYLNGGGAFSYSCLILDGSAISVTVTGGGVYYDNEFTYDPSGDPYINPEPVAVDDDVIEKPYIPPITCYGAKDPIVVNDGSGNLTYKPGIYTSDITINGGGTVTLEDGLYCFREGAGLRINGNNVTGNYVTLYFEDDAGGFDTAGMGTVNLFAPLEPCDDDSLGLVNLDTSDCSPAIPNVLIYVEEGNINPVTLGGNSSSYYEGVVYAPTSKVDVGGTSSELSKVGAQIIGYTVKVHGTVEMDITYDKDRIYYTSNYLNLEK